MHYVVKGMNDELRVRGNTAKTSEAIDRPQEVNRLVTGNRKVVTQKGGAR